MMFDRLETDTPTMPSHMMLCPECREEILVAALTPHLENHCTGAPEGMSEAEIFRATSNLN